MVQQKFALNNYRNRRRFDFRSNYDVAFKRLILPIPILFESSTSFLSPTSMIVFSVIVPFSCRSPYLNAGVMNRQTFPILPFPIYSHHEVGRIVKCTEVKQLAFSVQFWHCQYHVHCMHVRLLIQDYVGGR